MHVNPTESTWLEQITLGKANTVFYDKEKENVKAFWTILSILKCKSLSLPKVAEFTYIEGDIKRVCLLLEL